uniref:Uncharacterized protein n=1 Tax=Arundo donax TaxID=35708 RepID=A0A0A9GYI8_ARUDO
MCCTATCKQQAWSSRANTDNS